MTTFPSEKGPFRLRSQKYLTRIRNKPCLVCGGKADAHHLTFSQERAKGIKNGDQWAVPVCRRHHHELHNFAGGERTWWSTKGLDPIAWAEAQYKKWLSENP